MLKHCSRMPTSIPSLHCPVYMQVLLDPSKALLDYINDLPMSTSLCEIHANEILMLKAEKVTTIIHEVYPTESEHLGFYCDNDTFSFEGTTTVHCQTLLKKQQKKIKAVARIAGMELQYEHNLYDTRIKQNVEPNFSADWFEIPTSFYQDGPPLVHMPVDVIHSVRGSRQIELRKEHENEYQLTLDDMTN